MDLTTLLKIMVQKGASDMFLTAGVPPSIKVHGSLVPITKAKMSPSFVKNLVLGCMDEDQREEFLKSHECNFAIGNEEIGRFRVSALFQRSQTAMVIRRINTQIPKFEDLNVPKVLEDLSMTKRGLILVVGGTGSGKSTSLAAMIGYRNANSSGHIITIEDPIEFVHEHNNCIITQREVGVDTDSFEVALKNTLRQAPDVILIGEIRSRETMEYAIAFAETGHLAMATLHANNANQALDRIINFFPEERRPQLLMDLSLNLKAVLAQQLIPTVDGKGRRAAIEILLNTPLASQLIGKGDVHELKELMKKSTKDGMQTFDQALYYLFKDGEITEDAALKHADSSNEVRLMIKNLKQERGTASVMDGSDGFSLVQD
ncbi:MAG: PilT/PilU family type 4a pilus ATPase [Gammaproteobacteria bacterium]